MAWSAGAVVTATQLNTYAPQAWTSYTPALTALTTNPTLGNSTLTGKYVQHGNLLTAVRISLTIGSTFSAGSGAYFLSLPATCVYGVDTGIGTAVINVAGTRRGYVLSLASATTFLLMRATSDALLDHTGPGVAWATGHTVGLTVTCEVA